MNQTPKGERPHIALFGKRNAGKSSIINAITGQDTAIVSDVKGTTTDPVYKAMELLPAGPVMLVDTPGLDDVGTLGSERVKKSRRVLDKTDIALIVVDICEEEEFSRDEFLCERELIIEIKKKGIPYILVGNKCDDSCPGDKEESYKKILEKIAMAAGENEEKKPESQKAEETKLEENNRICVSAKTGYHMNELKEKVVGLLQDTKKEKRLIGDLLEPFDTVVLVVPIDSAAPKGRLILPQQQVIRDVLDSGAMAYVCRDSELASVLERLPEKPRLVITDSQAFAEVAKVTPLDVPLTSFSIIFARYKGDLSTQIRGIEAVKALEDGNCILMAEGCTHHRQCGDIGTVKIPNWLMEYTGKKLRFETCSGDSFPESLEKYALVVHCGGCMLPPKEMAHRILQAGEQGIPIVNYGTLIAHLKGVLSRSIEPFRGHGME